MFFIQPKKLILDCFTSDASAHSLSPIAALYSAIPDWWKELPVEDENAFFPETNMKKCPGFINTFKNGFVIPMWSDLHVEVGPIGDPNYRWQYSDKTSTLEVHNASQWGKFVSPDNYQHIKLNTPWIFRSSKECSFSWMPATWNRVGLEKMKGVHVLPGVDEYLYQSSTTINILLEKTTSPTLYKFPLSQPLVYGLPLTEERLEIKTHLITQQEFRKISNQAGDRSSFVGWYYKAKKIKSAKKCPFRRS